MSHEKRPLSREPKMTEVH
uniref:Uncharacterized protein n=1 Tax=Arundo donax TaxID=35708 RepID=A0A0A8ZWW6_ARUDO